MTVTIYKDGNSGDTETTLIASTVTSECRPVETEESDFVATHVVTRPTVAEKQRPVTFTNTERHKVTTGTCQHCRGTMIIKRAAGPKAKKYCSDYCRRLAFLARTGR